MAISEALPDQSVLQSHQQIAGLLDITYYTDPLCCWSWGFEPQWRKFLYQYRHQVSYRYCMAGLIPAWKNFHDSVNAVSRPIQMGPVWMHAAQLSGMPIGHNIWMQNPPASSYPACIAVKSAELQSKQAGEICLRFLREAVMIGGENIAKQAVIDQVVQRVQQQLPAFDIALFQECIRNETALGAFRRDLQEITERNVKRFPSLVIKNEQNKAVMIAGHRPYPVLIEAISQIVTLHKNQEPADIEDYKKFWPFATDREMQEITEPAV